MTDATPVPAPSGHDAARALYAQIAQALVARTVEQITVLYGAEVAKGGEFTQQHADTWIDLAQGELTRLTEQAAPIDERKPAPEGQALLNWVFSSLDSSVVALRASIPTRGLPNSINTRHAAIDLARMILGVWAEQYNVVLGGGTTSPGHSQPGAVGGPHDGAGTSQREL